MPHLSSFDCGILANIIMTVFPHPVSAISFRGSVSINLWNIASYGYTEWQSRAGASYPPLDVCQGDLYQG
jgi:hypothetical protein